MNTKKNTKSKNLIQSDSESHDELSVGRENSNLNQDNICDQTHTSKLSSRSSDKPQETCEWCEQVKVIGKNMPRHLDKCLFASDLKMKYADVKALVAQQLLTESTQIKILEATRLNLQEEQKKLNQQLQLVQEKNLQLKLENEELRRLLGQSSEGKFSLNEDDVILLINKEVIKTSTKKEYQHVWRMYIEWCKEGSNDSEFVPKQPLLVTTANSYIKFLIKQSGREFTTTTYKIRAVLQTILRRTSGKAVLLDKIRGIAGVKVFKRKKAFVNKEQIKDFLDFLKEKNSEFFYPMLIQSKTGTRINAVANLKAGHLFFLQEGNKRIYLPDSKTIPLEHGKYLDEETRKIIRQYYLDNLEEIQERGGYLFYCGQDIPAPTNFFNQEEEVEWIEKIHSRKAHYLCRNLNRELREWTQDRKMMTENGNPKIVRTHDIRRSVCENSKDEHMDKLVTKEISREIGHSNLRITKRYYNNPNAPSFSERVETLKEHHSTQQKNNIQESETESEDSNSSEKSESPQKKNIFIGKKRRSGENSEKIPECKNLGKIFPKNKGKKIKKKKFEPISKLVYAQPTKEEIKNFKGSFDKALKDKNYKFNDDLCFPLPDSNQHIQTLPPTMVEVFEKFKTGSRKKEYGPFELIKDSEQGWIVRTTRALEKNTIISEYTGEIRDFSEELISDSNMTYFRTPNNKLVINPDKICNLGRFISGVNNEKVDEFLNKKSKKKNSKLSAPVNLPNCQSQTFNVNGSIKVVIYTSRKIQKGETLYYDYNAGADDVSEDEQMHTRLYN